VNVFKFIFNAISPELCPCFSVSKGAFFKKHLWRGVERVAPRKKHTSNSNNTVRGVDMLRTVPPEALTHLYQIFTDKVVSPAHDHRSSHRRFLSVMPLSP
jgi:hypothetical protein